MKFVLQRVEKAQVEVDGEIVGKIGKGYLLLVGVTESDTGDIADKMIEKVARLRVFEDENGKMNLSVTDVGGEILMVSQFTLAGDLSGGNRPSFFGAEEPTRANQMYQDTVELLRQLGLVVKTGVFGADMKINQTNDGPVTINWQA